MIKEKVVNFLISYLVYQQDDKNGALERMRSIAQGFMSDYKTRQFGVLLDLECGYYGLDVREVTKEIVDRLTFDEIKMDVEVEINEL